MLFFAKESLLLNIEINKQSHTRFRGGGYSGEAMFPTVTAYRCGSYLQLAGVGG